MKIGVIVYPGSNCDRDVFHVLSDVLNVKTEYIKYDVKHISDYDGVVIPGGFSYGDHLRAGAIAARMPVTLAIKELAKEKKHILGICNGFQVLTESELLPGALARNACNKFVCRWTNLKVLTKKPNYTNKIAEKKILQIPIAHGEGNYFADKKILRELKENDQIFAQYVDNSGNLTEDVNPNGSVENLAGISNLDGNIVGMMPHPERVSEQTLGSEDGRYIFESMIESIKKDLR